MATYWLTFRLYSATVGRRSYDERHADLQEAIRVKSTVWWLKPTSFIAFASNHGIEEMAAACKRAIAPSHDMFLIREMNTQSAIICGDNDDDDIFKIIPYLKILE